MLAQKTSSPTFVLAHMTHIDNVTSILRHGLLSHNHPHNHRDISNYEVNQRRSRTEPCYGRTLHEYVPLYLNPRNAMLYSCQKRFGEDVIILTVKPEALRNRSFVFSNMNAACSSAQFFTDVQELHTLEWHNVNATRWCDNGVYFPEVRQKMMAELLIYPDIPVQYLSSFTCQSQAVAERVKFALKRANLFIDININPDFFFL